MTLSPNEWPPIMTIDPPFPPSTLFELRPEPADTAMLPPKEATSLESPNVI